MIRTARRAGAVALALTACGHPKADFEALPRLPSPESGSYGLHAAAPVDPAVASVVGKRPTDAYLDGVAAALALAAVDGRPLQHAWQLRDAAWRAGWPYEPLTVRVSPTEAGTSPPPDLVERLAAESTELLGVVRARSATEDVWVAVTAPQPRVDLGVIPREATTGMQLELPPVPGGRVVVSSPDGQPVTQPLDAGFTTTLSAVGEWLVVVGDADGPIARFPVYVGMPAPRRPVWRGSSASDPADQVFELFGQLRGEYGLPPIAEDPQVDAAAETVLRDPSLDLHAEARALGFTDASALSCDGRSITDCLDGWLWDPDTRQVLLDLRWGIVGVATDSGRDRVRVRLVLCAS